MSRHKREAQSFRRRKKKKEGKCEGEGGGRGRCGGEVREEREKFKLFELSPRSPHSFGIPLKSGLLFDPA